jgi:hypothetical protein
MLVSDMESVIADVLNKSNGKDLDLTAIEDLALEARHEFGKRVAQRLLNEQIDRHVHELPQNAEHKAMRPKGKKTKRSSHG